MFKSAPSIYVPVEPESNGIFLPLLLSALVHIFIIAFVFYTHRIPYIDTPSSIETSIITAEELKVIEADIEANRDAATALAVANAASQSVAKEASLEKSTKDDEIPQDIDMSAIERALDDAKRPTPIFKRSADTPTSNRLEADTDSGFDPSAIKEKEAAFAAAREAFAEQLAGDLIERQRAMAEFEAKSDAEMQALVDEYKQKANNPTQIEKPKRIDSNTAAVENPDLSLNDNGSTGNSRSSNSPFATTSEKTQVNRSEIKAQIQRLIQSRWSPPTGSTGQQLRASVSVDTNTGQVISVQISGSNNQALSDSLVAAIKSGPLTPVIGTNIRKIGLLFVAD